MAKALGHAELSKLCGNDICPETTPQFFSIWGVWRGWVWLILVLDVQVWRWLEPCWVLLGMSQNH